jgi:hypothetical protein
MDLRAPAEVRAGVVLLTGESMPLPPPGSIGSDAIANDSLIAGDNVSEALDELGVDIAGKIGDAPIDGSGYVRRDGAWFPEGAAAVGGLVFVDDIDKLPAAGEGVIVLAAGVCYYFTATIDLLGARLVLGDSTVLAGSSSETAILKSTGLDPATPLITAQSGGPNPIRNLAIHDVGIAFFIDGNGGSNAALDWSALNLINCGAVGTIRDVTNLIINTSAFLNTGGLTLDGSIQTAAFFQTIWTLPAGSGATAVLLPDTLTITRRFRWFYSPMQVPAGCTGFAVVDRAATFPIAESFGILFAGFTGAGSYLTGASYADDRTVIQSTLGLVNSSPSANYYMISNASTTAVASIGVFYKIAGVTPAGAYVAKFTVANNRATYTGAVPRFFRLAASLAMTAGSNHIIAARFAVNGVTIEATQQRTTASTAGRVESMSTFGVTVLNPGDYVEVWVANNSSATAILVTDLQVTATAVAG